MTVTLAAVIAVGWFGLIFWALAIIRSGDRRTPAPPARPRVRLVQSRERAGTVEILPTREEARR